jgi:hypothetical protein
MLECLSFWEKSAVISGVIVVLLLLFKEFIKLYFKYKKWKDL